MTKSDNLKVWNCPRCGGGLPEDHGVECTCEYCGSLIKFPQGNDGPPELVEEGNGEVVE